jgi:hypothetical protein
MLPCQNVVLSKCRLAKMLLCQNVALPKCRFVKMLLCQNVALSKCRPPTTFSRCRLVARETVYDSEKVDSRDCRRGTRRKKKFDKEIGLQRKKMAQAVARP